MLRPLNLATRHVTALVREQVQELVHAGQWLGHV
jgi:hypothetical protein